MSVSSKKLLEHKQPSTIQREIVRKSELPFFRLGTTLTPAAWSSTSHKARASKQYLALHPMFITQSPSRISLN